MRRRSGQLNLESGQALVIVLLSLSVVLTLVLYVLSRGVTDIAVSTGSEDSVRAFSAAEAGVEKSLIVGGSLGQTAIGDANYTTTVTTIGSGNSSFNYPVNLSSGETATIWFVNHDSSGNIICDATHPCFTGNNLNLCWGKPGTDNASATTPAIELSVFYAAIPGNYATIRVARDTFDSYPARRTLNSFSPPASGTCDVAGVQHQFSKNINLSNMGVPAISYGFQNGLLFARVRMLYNTDQDQTVSFDVGFAGNSTLPSQGLLVSSTGSAGTSNRKIQVYQGWPEVPTSFDFAVYSSTGVSK